MWWQTQEPSLAKLEHQTQLSVLLKRRSIAQCASRQFLLDGLQALANVISVRSMSSLILRVICIKCLIWIRLFLNMNLV